MSYGITLHVWGDYALFTRPEMKAERVSYDVMTPSAARGILEAIYWKPQIRWVIDRIHVLRPVQFTSIRRNEVASRASASTAKSAMNKGSGNIGLFIEDERQQRASLVLQNVAYVIEAHFDVLDRRMERGSPEAALNEITGKHLDIFKRRARAGQHFHHPYFGCREFPVSFELIEDQPQPASQLTEAQANKDLGFMLHDIAFDQDPRTKAVRSATPRFFRAELKQGILNVPPFHTAIA
jgi:CRISPR-associated protein Cas5d